jgi:DNA primase
MPVTWDEIDAAARGNDATNLVFVADDVPRRLDRYGDLFAAMAAPRP